jgi:hypothetical protein
MKLIDKLKEFVESDSRHELFTTTIGELREVFKPKEETSLVSKIEFYIYNSVWNRTPNFGISSVLDDKLKYAIGIGSGMDSYNQLPITWIEDNFFKFKNFLMKDRGHITTLLCKEYSKKFPIVNFERIVSKLISEHKAVDGWKQDYSRSYAVPILIEVQSYIEQYKIQQRKAGTKNSNQTLSIQMICENVPSFEKTLNGFKLSIEVRRESIYAHMSEILSLNNDHNKWIAYQKALLSFVGKVMRQDGSDTYFRNVLNVGAVRNHIDTLKTFNGDSKIIPFSAAIPSYKRRVSEYREIIPMRFLALRKFTTFEKRGPCYDVTKESEIAQQLMALRINNITESVAKFELTLMNQIADNVAWESYEKVRKNLLRFQPDKVDTNNLENASLGKEDFGMACIDAVMELRSSLPHMSDRKSEKQINLLVTDFVKSLIERLEEVVDDETLFNADKSMANRFTVLILPTYIKLKDSYASKSPDDSKQSIYETLLNEIKPLLNGQTKFKVVKLTNESYKDIEVTTIDFATTERIKSGLDLGQREQGMGYTIQNCILQQKHHNRSSHSGNHDISNIDYWKWYSKTNLELVMEKKDRFVGNSEFCVLADAEALNRVFNK